ncbi:ArnT family glycosyltransferase [Prochlorococcus marinus]|uniref:Glycosyl transferase n=1 Tax=Prochlorococcus marinus XMU1408 TaxID=2213228 RepID=A0A318QWD7_PROMR|nr:glycosyltransferase family 39 protein [Prochlorococcus marinus]MBW3042414.1 glycosyl transferase [Prochlorococcus marinus str. XMU1408]PYE01146.1 glycosyl transferase [Prochlorococcus marinus XMU1408]
MKSLTNSQIPSFRQRRRGLLFILFIGFITFIWQLGSTGLVDETPPLFAAASRAMAETGNWLTPQVNGLPRFDKPPLVYWLMGIGFSIPWNSFWDPLGTWASRLPSAVSTIFLMLVLGDTIMRYPQEENYCSRRTAIVAAMTFAFSPLVVIWGRIAVSDALLCSTLGICLLLKWRRYANPEGEVWWLSWIFLSLAVLTKGPVALILSGITIFFFGLFQNDFSRILKLLKVIPGLFIVFIISFPWYLIELLIEGKPFLESFFGYHNLQRFTSVVNSHGEPWWFFLIVLCIASLPFTSFLLISIWNNFCNIFKWTRRVIKSPDKSLFEFSFFWLISVFIFFTISATKLPSYWLPATPAASILISFSLTNHVKKESLKSIAWNFTIFLSILFSIIFFSSKLWIGLLNDPEIPGFQEELINSFLLYKAGFIFLLIAFLGIIFSSRKLYGKLLILQIPLLLTHFFIVLPTFNLADRLRQLPLRQASDLLLKSKINNETFVMVGAMKPSIHFYTNQVIIFEGRSKNALVNVSDRLANEKRRGWEGRPIYGKNGTETALLIIDKRSVVKTYWQGLNPEILGEFGVYSVWRINRGKLERRAKDLKKEGVITTWKNPRPERF